VTVDIYFFLNRNIFVAYETDNHRSNFNEKVFCRPVLIKYSPFSVRFCSVHSPSPKDLQLHCLATFFKILQNNAQQWAVFFYSFAVIPLVRLSSTKDIIGKPNSGECVLKSKVKMWSGVIECALYCGNVYIARNIKLDWLH